jgi:hypothetical protein
VCHSIPAIVCRNDVVSDSCGLRSKMPSQQCPYIS